MQTGRELLCAILLSSIVVTVGLLQAAEVRIAVDTSSTVNTMRGGIGASWHAIEKPISTTYDYVFPMRDHGGSGWGANPPAEDKAAWDQIYRHASWLGMDFIRVELEQRMYEPQRKAFHWDNPEMRILYRILDWCQENDVDVFLTQMWANVKWNAFPEFRDVPARVVHSGPYSIDDFAEGLATCVEYLVKTKKYTCIKHLCITNEPGSRWSWWVRPPHNPMLLNPGLEAVRKAMDKRGLDVPLIGPDTVGIPEADPKTMGYSDLLAAYEFHWYDARFDFEKSGHVISTGERALASWAKWAHAENKGLFIGELGTRAYGDVGDWSNSGVTSFPAAIHNAELVVRGIAVGVDGFNRWSFMNRGDLDGQYQMIDTWDREKKQLLKHFPPHRNIYYVYGMLSRFTAKHSSVLRCQVEGGNVGKHRRIFATAFQSPQGAFTLAIVNDAPRAWDLSVQLDRLKQPIPLYRYEVSQKDADRNDLTIEPKADLKHSANATSFSPAISPLSLTIYTTYKLSHNEKGVIVEPLAIVRVRTNEGLVGYAESFRVPPGVARAVMRGKDSFLGKQIIGEQLTHPERLWQKMYDSIMHTNRRGWAMMCLGALDIAIWDLYGKQQNQPVYELLGGAQRGYFQTPESHPAIEVIPYCTIVSDQWDNGAMIEDQVERSLKLQQLGYRAFKVEPMVSTVGHIVELATIAREALGPHAILAVDVGYRFNDVQTCVKICKILEDLDIYFFETPFPVDTFEPYAKLAAQTTVPLAMGEHAVSRWECLHMIDHGNVSVVQPYMNTVGGITEAKRIVEQAKDRGALVIPGNWSTQILGAATVHLAAYSPITPFIEFAPAEIYNSPLRSDLQQLGHPVVDGAIQLPTSPGIGIEVPDDLIQQYELSL